MNKNDLKPADNEPGHWLLLAGCLIIIIITMAWALVEALWSAAGALP